MRDRPLFSGCLLGLLIISFCVITGGAGFIKELRPSVLHNTINENSIIKLSGQVYDIDVKHNYHILFLKNNSILYQNNSFKESRIIVYDEEKLNIEIGNKVSVTGEISLYERERNPGNFNQKYYYQKQGIHASVWASKIVIINNKSDKVREFLSVFRRKWKLMLVDIMGEDAGTLLAAILLAEKNGMDEETKELYQANGISHILAISGLHLSVIGVGLYKIFRRISGSFVIGGVAGMIVLILYVLMIGVTVSVLRAFIMFLFRVGADVVGRHYDNLTALVTAAFITLLWHPLYLYDGGFWLSYGAILAIIFVMPVFESFSHQSVWASISIQVVTMPITLYFFYEIPGYSFILNLLIIPLMSGVLMFGLFGSVCSAIFIEEGVFGVAGLGGAMLWICKMIFGIYEKCCELFIKLPGARIVMGQPEYWQMIVYYGILIIAIILWRYRKYRLGFLVGMIIVNVLFMMFPVNKVESRMKEKMKITVLDVGQGDGIFVEGPEGKTYLIDSGSSDVKKVGKYRIEQFLKSQGIRSIDYVFVSHGDGDHISGIMEMIERGDVGVSIETIIFPNRKVWDEELKELAVLSIEKKMNVVEMKAGQKLIEGKMKISCLAPIDDVNAYTEKGNAASMVLALNYGDFDMLLTGDVEGKGEEILTKVILDSNKKISWEILKVAHHGSKNSTSEEFLKVVSPSYAVISAGRKNMYGHPSKETIKRLREVGSIILSTQENGAIMIVTDGEKMKVKGYVKEGV